MSETISIMTCTEAQTRGFVTWDIPVDELESLCSAYREGRAKILPCKVGDNYVGICREMVPDKKGWKTKTWLDSGEVEGIETIAQLTAKKAGYNHQRNIDELGESWFVGENAEQQAKEALERMGG